MRDDHVGAFSSLFLLLSLCDCSEGPLTIERSADQLLIHY